MDMLKEMKEEEKNEFHQKYQTINKINDVQCFQFDFSPIFMVMHAN